MVKRDDKLTRATHIKKHTKGTSNEISFSVLDAAKNALDGDQTGMEKWHPFGHVSLFTLPGRRKKPQGTPTKEEGLPLSTGDFVSVDTKDTNTRFDAFDFASSTMGTAEVSSCTKTTVQQSARCADPVTTKPKRTPQEEIALRKARRRLSKIMGISVIAITMVVLLAAGGTYLYREFQHQQSNVGQLEESLSLIKQADETLIVLDDIVSDPFAADTQANRTLVYERLDSVTQQLDEANAKARTASVELRDPHDKEDANQAVSAIAARQVLLTEGIKILDASQEAIPAIEGVDEAWNQVLEGDSFARDAAKLVTTTTAENVQASKDKTNKAIEVFTSASVAINTVQVSYPAADLTPLMDYVAKRIEALDHAVASDDAVLAKNKEEATMQNDAYNVSDAEAVALAKSIPATPSDIVLEAYKQVVADSMQAYSTARLQA